MQVVEFRPDLLPSLTRLINDQMAVIPPGCVFTEEQVSLILEQAGSLWGMHYQDDHEQYGSRTLCILHRREVVAAAQWLLPQHQKDVAALCWIVAHPRQPNALQTVLHLLEKQASGEGYRLIDCSRFSFGIGWFGIPMTWTHVVEGMSKAGFQQAETWTIMHGSIEQYPQSVPLPAHVKLYWDMNRPALEWTLTAYAHDNVVGECQVWGLPDHLETCEAAQAWATVEWIEVDGEYQRQKIATRLFAEQMRFHHQRGIRNFMMWVRHGNQPARALNESLGFQYGPDLAVFQKRLTPASEPRQLTFLSK